MNYRSTASLLVAEPSASYEAAPSQGRWLEVLVDCPGIQGLYTYRIPDDLTVRAGDILSIPLGTQVIGGIAIRHLTAPPPDLDTSRIRQVEDVITAGFFPPSYWELLTRTAAYYCTDLMTTIRIALPPGLLGRSQRRLRLRKEAIPPGAEAFCSLGAQQVLRLLQQQKTGDYSAQYLQRQVRGANRGIHELVKRGWLESYLEPPKVARPKQQKAVTLVAETFPADLTPRQREILEVLRWNGGEMWLSELLQESEASASSVTSLAAKGCVAITPRERLRLLSHPEAEQEGAKQLTTAQAEALAAINNLDGFTEVLLHGVTGSGKTEVYLQAIAPLLELGKAALVLVPEIGLTPQLTDRFRARFGNKVCVYHSALSDGERYDTWRQMLLGGSQIVIGTRSAVFAPLPNLGLIVLDEEHDSSFKQNQLIPTYHARNVARWRAQLANCPLILGSATPSLESIHNSSQSQSKINTVYLSLPERIQSRPLPPVEIVDMRQELKQGNRSIFSRSLQNAIANLQQQGQQGILFINRRGHSTFVSCRSCGSVLECPNCDVSLSYHYAHEGATELLRCHYCNYGCLQPRHCPQCDSPYLKFFGSGTQKVTQELTQHFPTLRWLRFDSDTTRTKGAHRQLLSQFARGEADVLVGTQMLTKGLDLAQVTLVGVVAADGLLHHSDYRAAERAFQTLTQVGGRAGRGEDPGKVIIQTYSPEHPVIEAVRQHDFEGFVTAELSQREALNYPPYGQLILIRLSGMDAVEVEQAAETIASACEDLVGTGWEILGPAPASIMRVARRYRWHVLLKFVPEVATNRPDFSHLRSLCPSSVSLSIDVDPLSLD